MEVNNYSVDSFTNIEGGDSQQGTDSLSIANLSKNKILATIAHKTGVSYSEIASKPQLKYLFNYLLSDHIKASTVVTEFNYVDKHYLDDYAKYYARCFYPHQRVCARLHFFSNKFNEKEFIEAIEGDNSPLIDELETQYIGYCIIRPLPESFLGCICLKPYPYLTDKKEDRYKVISRIEKVSLFGVKLEINTASLREQDKVLSACATSAAWTLLNTSEHISDRQIPSLSKITDVAFYNSPLSNRTLDPDSGLTSNQVYSILKHFGLEASGIQLAETDLKTNSLSRIVRAYASENIPVMLGGKVFKYVHTNSRSEQKISVESTLEKHAATPVKETPTGEWKESGDHFVCAMGYRNTPNNDAPNLDLSENPILNCYADTIDRYYVHDDRYGQYLSIQADKTELVCSVDSDPKLLGYHISKYDSDDSEIFVPQLVIAGFDSKIRVKYTDIENILESFYSLICSLFKSEKIDLWNTDKLEAIDLLDSNSAETLIQILSNPNWDIELLSNQNFRNQLREKKGLEKDYFFNSNLGGKERDILIKNLPKHIWRIRLRTSSGNGFQVQTDLLFDATEIMQGNIFIGYLSYTKASLLLWEGLKSSFNRDDWYQEASQDEESSFSKCNSINRKLRSSSDNLDKLFGVCRLPRRNLKDSELENGNPVQQNHIMVIPNDQTKNWETIAETSSPYIWVIDEFGHLVIGNEIIGTDEWKQGHPTLINYKLARIGGELRYNKETTSWTINTKSGAYSRHLWDKELQQIYLDKVKRLRFNNFPHDLSIDISDFEPT